MKGVITPHDISQEGSSLSRSSLISFRCGYKPPPSSAYKVGSNAEKRGVIYPRLQARKGGDCKGSRQLARGVRPRRVVSPYATTLYDNNYFPKSLELFSKAIDTDSRYLYNRGMKNMKKTRETKAQRASRIYRESQELLDRAKLAAIGRYLAKIEKLGAK